MKEKINKIESGLILTTYNLRDQIFIYLKDNFDNTIQKTSIQISLGTIEIVSIGDRVIVEVYDQFRYRLDYDLVEITNIYDLILIAKYFNKLKTNE